MNFKFRDIAAVAIITVSILAGLLVAAEAQEEGFTPIPVIKGMSLLEPGTEAPDFKVKDIEGQIFDFSQKKKEMAHLLVFWSIFCEPCREELPVIERVYNQYKGKGLNVLTVVLDGDPFIDSVRGFIKQGKYSFTVLMDELEEEMFKIADPYNVAGTPVMYFIDKEGKVSFGVLGRITTEELVKKIDQILTAQ